MNNENICYICKSLTDNSDNCKSCNNTVCEVCSLQECDWCDHMRTYCDPCPLCNKVFILCGGNRVCSSWITSGMYNNEIAYCVTHNNLVPTDEPPKSCSLIYDPESVSLKYQLLCTK